MSATLPSWARVGAKVVVVSVRPTPLGDPVPFSLGGVVTIGAIVRSGCISLVEYPVGPVTSYFVDRFRPLVDDEAQERDAAMFRKLLTTRQPVGEDA
jgi:hypothetical protein